MEGRLIILDQFNDRREQMNSEILELEKKEFVKRDIELDFIASQNLCSDIRCVFQHFPDEIC